jgi:hypothetical protein
MLRAFAGMAALLGLTCAGCGSSETPVTTHEVKGKVFVRTGNQPVKKGIVEFAHQTDPRFNARGDLDEEGNFSLYTLSGNKKLPGAAAGDYWVTVTLPQGADQVSHSKSLPALYKVEAKQNFFEIALDRLP